MRVLVVFAHPARDSFCGSILSVVLEEVAASGNEADLLDLYAENFNPVLLEEEWRSYEKPAGSGIQKYVDQLKRGDGVIWIHPTWNYGLPAILKGYVDRVWKPNVAFRIDANRAVHFDQFENLGFFLVATTFGASWMISVLTGNPSKRTVKGLRRHFSRSSRFVWCPIYGLDKPSSTKVERYLDKVRGAVRGTLSGK